jgi:hypothetical protein
MIFSSFFYEYLVQAGGNSNATVTIDMNFRALYQINPDSLIVLGYAGISGMRKDLGGLNVNSSEAFRCRLIGKFNETRNVGFTISVPRAGETITGFDGIAFGSNYAFYAPRGSRILMPPTFQLEFEPSSLAQTQVNDAMRVNFTLGYEIELKGSKF